MNRASTVYSANPKRSEGSVPGLKAPTNGWLISPDLNEVRVRPHKRSAANWALTKRPHKESGGNLKHEPCFHCVQREPEAQ